MSLDNLRLRVFWFYNMCIIYDLSGNDGNDLVYGGGGNNTITGGLGNNTINN